MIGNAESQIDYNLKVKSSHRAIEIKNTKLLNFNQNSTSWILKLKSALNLFSNFFQRHGCHVIMMKRPFDTYQIKIENITQHGRPARALHCICSALHCIALHCKLQFRKL